MLLLLAAAFTLAQLYWLFVLILPLAGWAGWARFRPYWGFGLAVWVILIIIGLALFGIPFEMGR